jgi:hypothetical protein
MNEQSVLRRALLILGVGIVTLAWRPGMGDAGAEHGPVSAQRLSFESSSRTHTNALYTA